jgi:glycosyltransferase involved in cell wall biosynthesis
MILSIILPFFHKIEEFKIALAHNKKFLKKDYELIIPIDEPDSEDQVLEIIDKEKIESKFLIKSNKNHHEWRNPAKAINVGIKNASGEFSIIMSPESILVTDVYSILIDSAKLENVSIGQVVFTKIINNDLEKLFDEQHRQSSFYGSICTKTKFFHDVRGYNEKYNSWGSDDDDIRSRLEKNGHALLETPTAKVLHYEKKRKGPKRLIHGKNLSIPFQNDEFWGQDF